MAGDWIKLETATIDKPEVIKLARLLGIPKTQAVGCLVVFWAWIDANSVDGGVDGVVDADVDALVDAPGFANALRSVGWLEIDNGCEKIRAPHFDRHNGKTAKNRALKTERQKNWRKKSVDGDASTLASTREEKRREEKKRTTTPPNPPNEKCAIPRQLDVDGPRPKNGNGEELSAGFEDFWAAYPKKVERKRALDIWRRKRLHRNAVHITADVRDRAHRDAQWLDGYVPNPPTYLNGERWTDEVRIKRQTPPEQKSAAARFMENLKNA